MYIPYCGWDKNSYHDSISANDFDFLQYNDEQISDEMEDDEDSHNHSAQLGQDEFD